MGKGSGERFSVKAGGDTYEMVDSLGMQQCQWIGKSVMDGVELQKFNAEALHDVMRSKASIAIAICCMKQNETRSQHAKLPWSEIVSRAADVNAELSPDEVLAFEVPFYRLLTPASVAMMLPGKVLGKMYEEMASDVLPLDLHSQTGSSAASSPSVMETSPSSVAFSPSGVQPSLSPISGAVSSERPSTEPSLAGSVSSSPG